jgi:hypothetical protein
MTVAFCTISFLCHWDRSTNCYEGPGCTSNFSALATKLFMFWLQNSSGSKAQTITVPAMPETHITTHV